MKTSYGLLAVFFGVLSAGASSFGVLAATQTTVTLKIRNDTQNTVYAWFENVSNGSFPGQTVTSSQQYCLASKQSSCNKGSNTWISPTKTTSSSSTYTVTDYAATSGRIYFSYGPFENVGTQPAMHNFADNNFGTRYGFVEMTIKGSTADTIDLTNISGFGIPFEMKAWNSGSRASTLRVLRGSYGNSIISSLSAVAGNPEGSLGQCPQGTPIPKTCTEEDKPLPAQSPNPGTHSPYLVINAGQPVTSGHFKNSPYSTANPGYWNATGAFLRVLGNENPLVPLGSDNLANVLVNNVKQGIPGQFQWPTLDGYLKSLDNYTVSPPPSASSPYGIVGAWLHDYWVGTGGQGTIPPDVTDPTYITAEQQASTFDGTVVFDSTYKGTFSITGSQLTNIQPSCTNTKATFTYTFTGLATLNAAVTPVSGKTVSVVLWIPYSGSVTSSDHDNCPAPTPNFLTSYPGSFAGAPNLFYSFYNGNAPETPFQASSNTQGIYYWTAYNDLIAKLAGDLSAGLNFGVIGSKVTLPVALSIPPATSGIRKYAYQPNTEIGSIPSQAWWTLGGALNYGTGSLWSFYFDFLQPPVSKKAPYYNIYPVALYPLTDAYAFAYGDRTPGGNVSLSWDATRPTTMDTVEVGILNDMPTSLAKQTPYVVNVRNSGNGNISTPNRKIDCGAPYTAGAGGRRPTGTKQYRTCSAFYPDSRNSVVLTATPNIGWRFERWAGDCESAGSAATCTLMPPRPGNGLSGNYNVPGYNVVAYYQPSPSFAAPATVSITSTGYGTVTSSPPGIQCGPQPNTGICSANFPPGQTVVLRASAFAGNLFDGWGSNDKNPCQGSYSQTCTIKGLTAGTDYPVSNVRFKPVKKGSVLIEAGVIGDDNTGFYTITEPTQSMSCYKAKGCSAYYPYSNQVTFTAIQNLGGDYQATGWGGTAISSTSPCVNDPGPCTFTVNSNTDPQTLQLSVESTTNKIPLTVNQGENGSYLTGVTFTAGAFTWTCTSWPCTYYFPPKSTVQLTTSIQTGATILDWNVNGTEATSCGVSTSCSVTLGTSTKGTTVTVDLKSPPPAGTSQLNVSIHGGVTEGGSYQVFAFSPGIPSATIVCDGSDPIQCSGYFQGSVTLTAQAIKGSGNSTSGYGPTGWTVDPDTAIASECAQSITLVPLQESTCKIKIPSPPKNQKQVSPVNVTLHIGKPSQ